MSLYLLTLDGDPVYVEAPSMPAAITAWRAFWMSQDGDPDAEPDQCSLVSDANVVREPAPKEKPHDQ